MIAGGEKCLYLWYKANIYCIFKNCVSERERFIPSLQVLLTDRLSTRNTILDIREVGQR